MSRQEGPDQNVGVEHSDNEQFGSLTVESGLQALRSSHEFDGTVEPLDGLDEFETCEHVALFYDSREERFATVSPFIRQGLREGERVMYVIDTLSEDAVIDELRSGDVDVDAAVESGQLTFHTLDETYLRTGRFNPDDMLDVYAGVIEEARDEYPGLRVTANTSWILDPQATVSDFMEYESRVNNLFEGEDCIALCHYDLNEIPPDTLVDVIQTHPHIVYNNTVCHNFYYTPPEEFFTEGETRNDVERMLRTLVDRSQARSDLNETIEELEESNERLRRFAYIASHDLQEPLRMVSSYLQLLENRYADDLDKEAQEYIDFAVNGSDRMREMVQGLLEYSRIDMNEREFTDVECSAIVDAVLDDLQVKIDEADATIRVGSLPAVHGNAPQLEQLFSNLISNGIKYSGDVHPYIEVSGKQQGSRCVFSVADNGIGMEPEDTDQIFEMFSRLHTHDEFDGTGIGLALCRKIVDAHDGDIWVDSTPGNGTTFYFTLPRNP